MTPRWIFLDVGNVLLDEDPLTFLSFRRHVDAVCQVRPDLSFAELLAQREVHAAAGSRWPVYDAVSPFLDDVRLAEVWAALEFEVRTRFDELSPPVQGAAEVVEELARHCRLGLIANQGSDCRRRLDALGLLRRFEVVAFADELGRHKPDLALFHHALQQAGAAPNQALMVGDRLDNDVAPALALGMAAAWIRWPRRAAKGWSPADPEGKAYLGSLERVALQLETITPQIRPSLVLDELQELSAIWTSGISRF